MNINKEIGWVIYTIESAFDQPARIKDFWITCAAAGVIYSGVLCSVYGIYVVPVFAIWWVFCVGITTWVTKRCFI